jgi:hypothetical protein
MQIASLSLSFAAALGLALLALPGCTVTTNDKDPDGVIAPDLNPDHTCSKGSCREECSAGQTCSATCSGGGCQQVCGANGSCTFTCSGGGCRQTCGAGASCSFTCSGNGCVRD